MKPLLVGFATVGAFFFGLSAYAQTPQQFDLICETYSRSYKSNYPTCPKCWMPNTERFSIDLEREMFARVPNDGRKAAGDPRFSSQPIASIEPRMLVLVDIKTVPEEWAASESMRTDRITISREDGTYRRTLRYRDIGSAVDGGDSFGGNCTLASFTPMPVAPAPAAPIF